MADGLAAEKRHLGRFLVVGCSSVAVDLLVYAGLMAVGCPRELAKGAGYLAGMVLGFVLNKRWTFGSRRAAGGEAVTYVVLYAVTFVVNVAVNGWMAQTAASLMPSQIALVTAFLVATAVTTVLNFLGMRFITFRRGIRERREQP